MIPRLLHRIWIGGPEPVWLQGFADSWVEHHPDWTLARWDDEAVRSEFPLDNQDLWDTSFPDPGHVGQFRADVLRYELLWRYGGLYVDADFECLRPIDPLIEGLDCFATWEEQDMWMANGLMGASPAHPSIRRLIDALPASIRAGQRPAQISGPRFLTRQWRNDPAVTILPQRHFYPYSHRDVAVHPIDERFDDPDLYAVHVWRNARRRAGLLPA